jgi:hypothetical protein
MGAAVNGPFRLDTMTNHPAATMIALGRQRLNGTFKAVENVSLAL